MKAWQTFQQNKTQTWYGVEQGWSNAQVMILSFMLSQLISSRMVEKPKEIPVLKNQRPLKHKLIKTFTLVDPLLALRHDIKLFKSRLMITALDVSATGNLYTMRSLET